MLAWDGKKKTTNYCEIPMNGHKSDERRIWAVCIWTMFWVEWKTFRLLSILVAVFIFTLFSIYPFVICNGFIRFNPLSLLWVFSIATSTCWCTMMTNRIFRSLVRLKIMLFPWIEQINRHSYGKTRPVQIKLFEQN